MYQNIGGKIKGFAKFIFILGIILSMLTAILLALQLNPISTIAGIIILVLGPLFSYIGSWLLYGYGELIEKACSIESCLLGKSGNMVLQSGNSSERIKKIERLRAQGLITEQEYKHAMYKALQEK